MELFTVPLGQAEYCANPDLVDSCLSICPDPGLSSIGVRVGAYLQAVAFFFLVVLAPDEDGAESIWAGLSVSYSLTVTGFVMAFQGGVTSHHMTVVFLLSMLPFVGTLGALNSLTAYQKLGMTGIRVLQAALILRGIFCAISWAMVLYTFYAGQLPSAMHFGFRQPACFEDTALVLFFYPVRPSDENSARSSALLIVYTVFWALVILAGSWWTIRAPMYLRKDSKHHFYLASDTHSRQEDGGSVASSPDEDYDIPTPDVAKERLMTRKQFIKEHPDDYKKEPALKEMMETMSLRSLPKSSSSTRSATSSGPLLSEKKPKPTPPPREQIISSKHTFFIWPIVACLLVLNIVAIELQIALNSIFPGELHLDHPGTLSLLLSIPTAWAVVKAYWRIHKGDRPRPQDRERLNFFSLEHAVHRMPSKHFRLPRRRQGYQQV